MSRSRRPSVSIYDYPEHLNPFNDDNANSQPGQIHRDGKTSGKESKHKFWTFGRSRKKRSNSFSIKSTWNGLFGKRKEPQETGEKRSTITTVSSTYKREPYERPVVPPRISRDQQEFDEALGTLTRRRKYTLDSGSRYSSSLTVNGDPARIYDGVPQDTTASIMGDLTPKPPARRFGQVSPRPTDKIPPLNYEDKEPRQNGVTVHDKPLERTPVPPLRRFGNRSSQRLNGSTLDSEEETGRSADVTLRDENENVPEDYVFKRFSQDAVRRSNLSINSCVSVGSTASTYGRKKRRAPQPPRRKEPLETPEENESKQTSETPNIELQITEPIDITVVTENIDEMTKKSREMDEPPNQEGELKVEEIKVEKVEQDVKISNKNQEDSKEDKVEIKENTQNSNGPTKDSGENAVQTESANVAKVDNEENNDDDDDDVQIEYQRTSLERLEIIKDVDHINSQAELQEVRLKRKSSSDTLFRSDSFSVKDEIEKIEKQIKALESRENSKDSTTEGEEIEEPSKSSRLSIQANRRHFFENMVDNRSGLKIEFKELPREQKDVHVVRITDPPVPVDASRDPVKIIELHISEPIKQKPELLEDVNPIPKPRRHSALNGTEPKIVPREKCERGKSF